MDKWFYKHKKAGCLCLPQLVEKVQRKLGFFALIW